MIEYKVYYYPKKGSTFKLYHIEANNKEEAIEKAKKKVSGTVFRACEVYNPFRKKNKDISQKEEKEY